MKKFLVALAVGGLIEQPNFSYCDYDLIEATTEKEAVEIYNKKHKCSYFYGRCLGCYNPETDELSIQNASKVFSIEKLLSNVK